MQGAVRTRATITGDGNQENAGLRILFSRDEIPIEAGVGLFSSRWGRDLERAQSKNFCAKNSNMIFTCAQAERKVSAPARRNLIKRRSIDCPPGKQYIHRNKKKRAYSQRAYPHFL